ncbi:alpha-amylase family glycosyl hydrolase [Psychroserpens sp.]|uniref:alpha-amylase family glycosyl hydrolase n=1 Tax=Psychroserpens sp. TaxID=2020870 RepID=UPI001AFECCD5|nr:alpha-amylase family glycosyl hydrolase [Psychroserpens sp.]MBO6605744.1 alpha-amylase [Psychroserpens sp.]MBO6630114.1 alpha-amylase [Psychroserpens sp.]MBO6652885.1 alpha-amylase [Psychroserpens sp.]MBO6681343.1 alpha-amylase [Psychroserpens sp.]MBO6749118.1 alpha-amylase [Psychroserpens sp.]
MKNLYIYFIAIALLLSCKSEEKEVTKVENKPQETPFVWEGANLYFLLTDRFNNGDTSNDINFDRTRETGLLRGFEGGDIKGITQKVKEGYFTDLGINAIWMTPIVEQIHGGTDEGTGVTYGFHGYWTKDWTKIDPNYGTKEDLHELVTEAHKRGIRIVLDAVINHTGPVTEKDPVWPDSWVRTSPQCEYSNYENTITCTLVRNLPDIKTESNEEVDLPPQLVEKWKAEGRYEQEVAELDAFFERTGHPRAPRFYIMKWLTDYITEFGIDGYRCDTVKHTEEFVWQEFKTECDAAFQRYKSDNPEKALDDNDFYIVGEVYNYGISGGKYFNFGDKQVNYFNDMFTSQINFEFKWNAKQMSLIDLFARYDDILQSDLKGYGVLNYLSSHDDGSPFDKDRNLPKQAATILLLAPGTSQVYYGDEVARSLNIEGTQGDATLRSVMNWDDVVTKKEVLSHWQKLGQFRNNHPAVGAGIHEVISKLPYTFSRIYTKGDYQDKVLVAFVDPDSENEIDVSSVFTDGSQLFDAYSNQEVTVKDGTVSLKTGSEIVLLEFKS